MAEPIKNRKTNKVIVFVVCLVFLGATFVSGFVAGKITDGKINLKMNPELYKQTALGDLFDNQLVKQVYTILKEDYVDKDKIDDKKLFYGAMRGFVYGLEEPYTMFMDPEMAKEFDNSISGEFEGIGAEITIKNGVLTIVAPLPNTPAAKTGLLAGDKVIEIDGKKTNNMSLEQAVRQIRGPGGTTVKLLVYRDGEEPKDYLIIRETITIDSVKWTFRDDGLAHVELVSFNEDTMDLLSKFVQEAAVRKPKGIILDLRNDPGGLLDVAIDVSSLWIEDKIVVSEKFSNGEKTDYKARHGAPLRNFPTVVLINQGSASASEIVAGAFQDYGTARLIGVKSFGKGSVQELKKLPDGSAIKVTVAKWLTPLGKSINEEGVTPDEQVEITREDFEKNKDPQLTAAVDFLIGRNKKK